MQAFVDHAKVQISRRTRQLANAGDRKVWFFMGDGESDEPESMGALTLAARERLDATRRLSEELAERIGLSPSWTITVRPAKLSQPA